MKGMISYYGEYTWDPVLSEIDRRIHFGIDPWRIIQPWLGQPNITRAVSFIYTEMWGVTSLSIITWQLFSIKNPHLRTQFFLTFILIWSVNGTLLAILFASGGPCFYEFMTGSSYYATQMNYLNTVNNQYGLLSVDIQNTLLSIYQVDRITSAGGISAMPSMHISQAFLLFLFGSCLHKWMGRILGLFFLMIFIGSIHLGWHYAIDGYCSIIMTWILWKLSGVIIKKLDSPSL